MVVYVDMDETLCDTYKATQWFVNEFYYPDLVLEKEKLTSNRTIHWLVNAGISEETAAIIRNNFSSSLDYWANRIPIADGAYDVMKHLCKHHQVHIATSVFLLYNHNLMPFNCMKGKLLWLRENLPFYDIRNTIYTNFKYNLIGDVLIEDVPEQLKGFHGRRIIRDYPYNRKYKDAERFIEWPELEKMF